MQFVNLEYKADFQGKSESKRLMQLKLKEIREVDDGLQIIFTKKIDKLFNDF